MGFLGSLLGGIFGGLFSAIAGWFTAKAKTQEDETLGQDQAVLTLEEKSNEAISKATVARDAVVTRDASTAATDLTASGGNVTAADAELRKSFQDDPDNLDNTISSGNISGNGVTGTTQA